MKIACIIHSLDGGGAERAIAALASRLAKREHSVTLITLDDGSRERHGVDPAVARRRLDLMSHSGGLVARIIRTRRRVRAVRDAIGEAAPDVVLSFCDRTNILVLMASKNLDVPVVISERSDPSQQDLGAAWEYLRSRTYRRAAAIIALTESSASYLGKRLGSSVDVIPSAVDIPPISSDRESAVRSRRILGVGRLEYEKGFDRLIEAFAQIACDSPGWSLRILGEGSLRGSLEERIERHRLADRVELAGWIQPIWEELAAATLFALPSRYEGFPSALLEAMAVGVPSIAVDCESGPRAVIGDDQCGLLVDNTITALAAGIDQLIKDDARREALGVAGKDVAARFSWDRMVDGYEVVLRRVVEQR